MATDDVGDLFDTDDAEESVDWDELSSVDDDEAPPGEPAPDGFDEFEGAGRATGDETDPSGTSAPGVDPRDQSEVLEPTASEAGVAEGAVESGPGGSGAPLASEDPPHGTGTEPGPTEATEAAPAPADPGSAVGESTTAGGSSPSTSNRLGTGIDELDRAMGGGVPPGRLVVLVADPGVQSELIVDSLLAQRDTLFVTTDRPDWEVTKDIEPGIGTGEVVIRDHTPDSLLSGVDSLLEELGPSSNLVLDSVNELELVPRQRYRRLLSDVKRRLFDTGSVGLLTGVTVGHESARDLTLRRADVVWRLETRTVDGQIENHLSVPKFRGGAALTETVRLELTDEVRVVGGRGDE